MQALTQIQDFDDPAFDPLDESEAWGDVEDFPQVMMEAWRRGGSVQRGSFRELVGLQKDVNVTTGQNVYMVFGGENIRRIYNDPATFSQDHLKRGFRQAFGPSISQMNPPEHTRFRRLFQKVFFPGAIRQWSDSLIDPVIEQTIGEFKDRGRTEIVESFTYPYPFRIIYKQLDLPEADIAVFLKLAVAQALFQTNLEKATEAGRKLGTYFQLLVEEKRRKPSDDLVSLLVNVEDDGKHLPDEVIISFLRQLINAAGDTTFRSTSNMLVCLLRDRPDQWQLLLEDRSLIPAAVEEALRLYGPLPSGLRTVTREVEIDGVAIPAGSIVEPARGLVGRDPAIFDDPDRYDLTRGNMHKHMTFGNGPHICLGQHLARLEMARALGALLDHLPRLRLDPDYPPPRITGVSFIAAREIHVRFD